MDSKINRDEVRHVALLARLELSDGEEELMTAQMNGILEYVDKLNELDTNDIEPTAHAIELRNVFRPDRVEPSLDRKDSLANAPGTDGVNFVVPRIL